MNEPSHDRTNLKAGQDARPFTLWALETLGIAIDQNGSGVYSLTVPEMHREHFDHAERLQIRFEDEPELGSAEVVADTQLVTIDSKFFLWLMDQLCTTGTVVHAIPREQADSVHDLAPRLFDTFTVDGGRVQLAGCTFDDRPFCRLTYRTSRANSDSTAGLTNVVLDERGLVVDPTLADSLRLDDVASVEQDKFRVSDDQVQKWSDRGDAAARESFQTDSIDAVVRTAIWCKFVEGKLVFQIGDAAAETKFSGWAQQIADGSHKPAPFSCALTGKQSYHLAATDDGRITVVEAIVTCDESGSRVLPDDLETCIATGKCALPQYFTDCPVTGERVIESGLERCAMCGQRVSPLAIARGRCLTCRSTKSVSKDEPRVVRVLEEFPGLDRWRSWQIAESAKVYVLVATGLVRRLVVVVDHETLELRRLATGGRFFGQWVDVPEELRDEKLK